MQINYMHEVKFRLNDYFFYQWLYAMTDANPYWGIIERLRAEMDPFSHKPGKFQESSSENGTED